MSNPEIRKCEVCRAPLGRTMRRCPMCGAHVPFENAKNFIEAYNKLLDCNWRKNRPIIK